MAQQRDYLERIIQQLVQALAAIATHRRAGEFNGGLQAVRAAMEAILGPQLVVLETFDAGSAIMIAGAERVRVYAALVAEEALIHDQAGDEASAFLCAKRAMELDAALRTAGTELSLEDRASIAVLSRRLER